MAVIVPLFALFAGLTILREQALFSERHSSQAAVLGTALNDLLGERIYRSDVDGLRRLALVAQADPDLERVYVFDHNSGRLLADSWDPGMPVGDLGDAGILALIGREESAFWWEGGQFRFARPITFGGEVLGGITWDYHAQAFEASTREVLFRQLAQLLAFVLAAGLLAFWLAHRLTGPITQLATAARAVSAGRLEFSASTQSPEDMMNAARSFEQMAASLRLPPSHIVELDDLGRAINHLAEQAALQVTEMARHVQEREQAAQALLRSEERYRAVVEMAPDIIYSLAPDGALETVNPAFERITGWPVADWLGRPFTELVDQKDHLRAAQALEQVREGRPPLRFESQVAARSGDRLAMVFRMVPKIHGGRMVGVLGIARDVTEQRRQAQVGLRQGQKLEALGRLTAGIAHEINTPIQFIGDNVRFVQQSFADLGQVLGAYRGVVEAASCGPVGPALLEEAQQAEEEADVCYLEREVPQALADTLEGVDRVATIVRGLRDFAHPDATERAPADINRGLLSTLAIARNEIKYVAEVQTELGELPPVLCKAGELNQVFLNLLVNAAQAIEDAAGPTGQKGRILVRTFLEGDEVVVALADTGCGIPEAIRERIFEPFVTTKEPGRGTGQGLSLAKTVVEQHGGTLTFESEVGRGTTFYLRLPAIETGPEQEEVAS